DELIEQFERETAQPQPAAEPGADSGEPVLGATQAPAEQVPQPEPLPDPVAKILADNLLPAELRQEVAQVDAARQAYVREVAERDFKLAYSDLARELSAGFPHLNPDLVGTIVAGRLFQVANSDPRVVRAFDNRYNNPRLYNAAIKHIGRELDNHL